MNPYAILDLPTDATEADVRRAYRAKAKTEHPDTGGSPEKFALLKRAEDILSDPGRRARYDQTGSTEETGADNALSIALQMVNMAVDITLGKLAVFGSSRHHRILWSGRSGYHIPLGRPCLSSRASLPVPDPERRRVECVKAMRRWVLATAISMVIVAFFVNIHFPIHGEFACCEKAEGSPALVAKSILVFNFSKEPYRLSFCSYIGPRKRSRNGSPIVNIISIWSHSTKICDFIRIERPDYRPINNLANVGDFHFASGRFPIIFDPIFYIHGNSESIHNDDPRIFHENVSTQLPFGRVLGYFDEVGGFVRMPVSCNYRLIRCCNCLFPVSYGPRGSFPEKAGKYPEAGSGYSKDASGERQYPCAYCQPPFVRRFLEAIPFIPTAPGFGVLAAISLRRGRNGAACIFGALALFSFCIGAAIIMLSLWPETWEWWI